ncbi:imidazolonepropionase [Streptoalloteichus tenebrarius]|uniref:Imidazolonepropionase n=1 Tax=Streptoalloteichus tenebrarius (strain ATCC 17920 / DSM 40477 / JCM 4838 / CBS 697.72 / NBRC 16177 / NCIMB 11028 / NRRL B-12390 / A12253. 1 / ISP 5477) TaxID=1933 RepID=A0ABT1HT81_STRSD|nr:imidazolonepropionase [Streptoalloteichus tenebrarius]MCP2258731.1 imidazolonepropionase [Streptoalloteichus tenebrarius]BFF02883.1 imidazolonepropionase [Streptoalloteichus tenebrarius]
MSVLITGIGELTTNDDELGTLPDAAVVLDEDRVVWVGPADRAPDADERVDVGGRAVLPGWVDSHTHLVFAGDRTAEFAARMAGQPYQAGGIAVTVAATRAASDADLAAGLRRHVAEAVAQGTTCFETKTGYGLTVTDEVRSARIAAQEVEEVTFLGAHLVPQGWDADEYVRLVCGEMLDAVAPHVGWVDVFCESGAFDEDQSRAVLAAAKARGLGLRVHGNQLGPGPGVPLAVEMGAASVDHCTYLEGHDIDALAASQTVATLLPACDLSTRQPLPNARELLDAGATVALASNCNPGSSYTSSMAFCVATAVLQMRMSVEEAVRAATWGGARALRRESGDGAVGVLRPGARADVHVLDAPSAAWLAYRPGVPLTHAVWRKGVRVR